MSVSAAARLMTSNQTEYLPRGNHYYAQRSARQEAAAAATRMTSRSLSNTKPAAFSQQARKYKSTKRLASSPPLPSPTEHVQPPQFSFYLRLKLCAWVSVQ